MPGAPNLRISVLRRLKATIAMCLISSFRSTDMNFRFESQPLRHLPSRKRSPDPAAAGFFCCFRGLCWKS